MNHNIAFCSNNVGVSLFDMHVDTFPSAGNSQVSTHLPGKAAKGDILSPKWQTDISMIPDEPDAKGTADLPSAVSSTKNPVVPGNPEEETTAVLPCSDSSNENTMIPVCQLVWKKSRSPFFGLQQRDSDYSAHTSSERDTRSPFLRLKQGDSSHSSCT